MKCVCNRFASTYVDTTYVTRQWKNPGGRRLLWHEPVELLVAKVPFYRVQRNPFEVIVARQPQRLACSDGFGIPNSDAFQSEHVCEQKRN